MSGMFSSGPGRPRLGSECRTSVTPTLTSVPVDFPIVVLDELFDEGSILVQDLVPHVGDIVKHRLILHLMVEPTTRSRSAAKPRLLRDGPTSSHTMKFCCRGDQEYMTGTEATAFRVFRGMTCLGNSEKLLSTVHWRPKHSQTPRPPPLMAPDATLPTSRVPLSEPTEVMM